VPFQLIELHQPGPTRRARDSVADYRASGQEFAAVRDFGPPYGSNGSNPEVTASQH
jgi:hypothetical protein